MDVIDHLISSIDIHEEKQILRRKTHKVKIGNAYIGGDAPILVQSMTNTDTADITKTVEQVNKLLY